MKIFSKDQIREIEQATLQAEGLTMHDLIERGAQGIAREIAARWTADQRMVVFAGWGNNGADALASMRLLMRQGYNPEIFLFNIGGNRLSAECAQCREELLMEFPDVNLTEVTQRFDIPDLDRQCVVVDALFGSGLEPPIPRAFSVIIRSINESGADIVSIDIPSGLLCEWNESSITNDIIHATLTLTIEFPKLSFFIEGNSELIGEWVAIPVGLSRQAIREKPYSYYLITDREVRRFLKPRALDSTKDDYGSALICAGSYGMMGAAILATRACLRAGAGRVTCYSPRCGYFVMQTAVPSAMFMHDTHEIAISEITLQHNYNSVAMGPGIGTADITINALENFLKIANANSRPLVIDADAINCIARRPIMLNYLPVLSVLTPHASEFDRLFGAQPSAEARLRKAIEVANYHNIVIVLKGRYTAIVRPDGKVLINSSGTPALATAGSGDVLTGVISAFMAQDYTPETAATIGAYIHGVAGELSERQHGTYGVTAEDVADNVGRAIQTIME